MAASAEAPVLIMAGGTGGHVFPALAVAEVLRQQGTPVHWLGTRAGIEARLVPAAELPLHTLTIAGIRGKGLPTRLRAIAQAVMAVWTSSRLIRALQPRCVLGMGGYAAGPGGIAAWLTRVPLVIHEQNAVAGTTNRLLARFARLVLTGYPIALGGSRNRYIGNPVRQSIAELPVPSRRWQGRTGALRLLVLGGSQGARALNENMIAAMALLAPEQRPDIWHQAGSAHLDTVIAGYRSASLEARVEAFIEDMAAAYAWADVVFCRAGALTVAELAAAGLGAILVPLPQAIDDHQRANARWLVEAGAGEILEQAQLSPDRLAERVSTLSVDRNQALRWAEAARSVAKIDAAQQAANSCLEVAHA